MTLCLLVPAVPAFSASAPATLTVCPAGAPVCDYSTIRAALTAAAPGDTIVVEPGVYVGNLVVAKEGVTVRGTDRDGVVVDARAPRTYGIHVQADGVTLDSFTLLGPNTANLYGIHASRAPSFISGLTIQDVTVRGSLRSEVDLHGARDALLTGLVLDGNGTGGLGLGMTDSANVVLRDITTTGNGWGGIALYTNGVYVPGGTDNVTLTGQNALGELDAFFSQTHNGHAVTNVHVDGQFAYHVFDTGFPTYTWYARDLAHADAIVQSPAVRPTPATSAILTFDGATAHVLDGMNIQRAVDRVAAGGSVLVAPGTYPGGVTLGKKLTLQGAGDGADPATSSIVQASGVSNGLQVAAGVDDSTLTIADLRVTGARQDGIRVTGATENLVLRNVSASGNGRIGFNVAEKEVRGLRITDSHFDDNGNSGFYAEIRTNPAPVLDDVLVQGSSFNGNKIKGIYVERLSNAVLEDIEIVGSGWDPAYAWNAGIDLNMKYANYSNIRLSDVLVSTVAYGTPTSSLAPVAVTVKARDDGPTYGARPATLENVIIERLTVVDAPHGVRIGEPGAGNAGPTNVVVRESDLSGVQGFGVIDATSGGRTDARFNWWGSPMGPRGAFGLGGVPTSGAVSYAPWCLDAGCSAMGPMAPVVG